MAYVALPFSRTWVDRRSATTGLLFTFAVMSLVPLGIVAAGWASNNKWSLLGGMRAVGSAGHLRGADAARGAAAGHDGRLAQPERHRRGAVRTACGLVRGCRALPAFVLFLIAGLIEANQTPFDMSEAESELVAGFATEYASMKFGLLFLSEFSNIVHLLRRCW